MTMRKSIAHAGGFAVEEFTFPGPFASLVDIKAANRSAGKSFFGNGETRFFRSEPLSTVYHGRVFIDST